MTMFLITRGIKPADVVNLEPGTTPFPESVIDMLMGQKNGRPGSDLPPLNLQKSEGRTCPRKLKREVTDDDLYSHLMYPEVFAEFAKFTRDYSDVSVLPTPAFFYGLKPGEEISVSIEEGKILFIKLINIGPIDKDGRHIVNFELNGMPREAAILDRSVQVKAKAREKADPANPLHVGAPIPGLITSLAVSVGTRVAKGDKLITMEAMKMQTTIYASADGLVSDIFAQVGDTVESKDLIVKLKGSPPAALGNSRTGAASAIFPVHFAPVFNETIAETDLRRFVTARIIIEVQVRLADHTTARNVAAVTPVTVLDHLGAEIPPGRHRTLVGFSLHRLAGSPPGVTHGP